MRIIVMCLLLLGVGPAIADPIYRWVDIHGVVNYGSALPEKTLKMSGSERAIDTSPPVVSRDASGTPLVTKPVQPQGKDDALRQRLLEEQIATEQARAEAYREQAARDAAARRLAQARARCIANRGIDCDSDGSYADNVVYATPLYGYARPPRRIMGPPPAPQRAATARTTLQASLRN